MDQQVTQLKLRGRSSDGLYTINKLIIILMSKNQVLQILALHKYYLYHSRSRIFLLLHVGGEA